MTPPTEPRRWLHGLTADEWLHLAAEGNESEVGPCCAVLSDLREMLRHLAVSQGEGESWVAGQCALEAYETALGYHDELGERDSFPLLHRVLDGIREERP